MSAGAVVVPGAGDRHEPTQPCDGDDHLDVQDTEAVASFDSDDIVAAHSGCNDGARSFEIFGNIEPIDGKILQCEEVAMIRLPHEVVVSVIS